LILLQLNVSQWQSAMGGEELLNRFTISPAAQGDRETIGFSWRHRDNEQGFTFLELLTVLALMALLLGLVAPTFYRGWERERLRASLRDLSAVLRLARSMAVTERGQARVFVDLEQGRYWLEGTGRQGQLPAGTRFSQAALVWPDQGRRLGYIAFYGDGASSGGHLDLEGPRGRRYTVNVDIITSKVSVGEGG
jgi:prepilin-type N-terminal cleavage/methylation domain-containing protein